MSINYYLLVDTPEHTETYGPCAEEISLRQMAALRYKLGETYLLIKVENNQISPVVSLADCGCRADNGSTKTR